MMIKKIDQEGRYIPTCPTCKMPMNCKNVTGYLEKVYILKPDMTRLKSFCFSETAFSNAKYVGTY